MTSPSPLYLSLVSHADVAVLQPSLSPCNSLQIDLWHPHRKPRTAIRTSPGCVTVILSASAERSFWWFIDFFFFFFSPSEINEAWKKQKVVHEGDKQARTLKLQVILSKFEELRDEWNWVFFRVPRKVRRSQFWHGGGKTESLWVELEIEEGYSKRSEKQCSERHKRSVCNNQSWLKILRKTWHCLLKISGGLSRTRGEIAEEMTALQKFHEARLKEEDSMRRSNSNFQQTEKILVQMKIENALPVVALDI